MVLGRTDLTHHGQEEHYAKRGLSGEKSKDLIITSIFLYFLSTILSLLSVQYCDFLCLVLPVCLFSAFLLLFSDRLSLSQGHLVPVCLTMACLSLPGSPGACLSDHGLSLSLPGSPVSCLAEHDLSVSQGHLVPVWPTVWPVSLSPGVTCCLSV